VIDDRKIGKSTFNILSIDQCLGQMSRGQKPPIYIGISMTKNEAKQINKNNLFPHSDLEAIGVSDLRITLFVIVSLSQTGLLLLLALLFK
jgi:hypothetical protein